jgi:predicted O-methyltransferase YrrM
VLDERLLTVLRRLEREDEEEREAGVARELRSRQVAETTGKFLFALVASNAGCEVLEIGGSRGYSTIWLAAGVRQLGGRVVSLENDPRKIEAWRRNIAEAGVEEWAELLEGDALQTLPALDDVFDVVFLDAEKEDYERLFELAREKLEPGGLVVTDNVIYVTPCTDRIGGAAGVLAATPVRPVAAQHHRPAGSWDRAVRHPSLECRHRGKEVVRLGRFLYGQWRCQPVGTCPRDLRGIV